MAKRKAVELNLEREEIKLGDINHRLEHKKECRVTVKRTRNKLVNAIEQAWELVRSGRLHAEGDVECVNSELRLRSYMQKVRENGEIVIDLETTGLDTFNDIIVGVCLYTPHEKGIYIPVNHTDINNNRVDGQLKEDLVAEIMKDVLIDKEIKVITHNGKFDGKMIKWWWKYGIANFYFDTLIGGHLLNENENHQLKPLYNKYVRKGEGDNETFSDLFEDTPFNYIPIEIATIYGANDGFKTYELYRFQSQYINRDSTREDMKKIAHVFWDIEMRLYPVLIDIELRGVEIRTDYAKELLEEMNEDLQIALNKLNSFVRMFKVRICEIPLLNRLTGGTGEINYSSPEQLKGLLYDVLKIKPVKKKKGTRGQQWDYGTGEDILLLIKEKDEREDVKQFVDDLLRYRELKKLITTYVEKIPNVIDANTGAVHTNFNQIGAVTGRFSSSHPISKLNLQNIPSKEKRIRKMFKAREGYKLIGGDFSQIEPRTLASLSGDEEMINAYKNKADLYALMASKVYNLPIEQCKEFYPDGKVNPEGKQRRTSMKSVLLGIMYERGAKDIANQFNQSVRWAEGLIENFKKAYPKIELYRMLVIHHAETFGWVSTLDGRKRRLADMQLSDHDSWKYMEAHRQCLNAVIQGTAGDIMKKAMVKLGENEEFKSLGGQILMTIHDEMICEILEEHTKRGAEIMKECMLAVGYESLGLPMSVDIEVNDYWYGENQAELYGVA